MTANIKITNITPKIGIIKLLNAIYNITSALIIDTINTVGNYSTVRFRDSREPVAIPVKYSSKSSSTSFSKKDNVFFKLL